MKDRNVAGEGCWYSQRTGKKIMKLLKILKEMDVYYGIITGVSMLEKERKKKMNELSECCKKGVQ